MAFADIERCLKEKAPRERHRAFCQLVEFVGSCDTLVKELEIDLKEYADLRNAIIHEHRGGAVIAQPNDHTVEDIERIAKLLRTPPTAVPLFSSEITELFAEQHIAVALELMREQSISQIPIRKGNRVVALLTPNTIARWLGARASDGLVDLANTPIASVLQYTEEQQNHVFVGQSATVFDLLDLFHQFEHRGTRLEAILVTSEGKADEAILGIVTISDLPKAYQVVSRSTARR